MKEIPLTQGFVALVDDEDYPILSRHNWHVISKNENPIYYAEGRICKHKLYMHHLILGKPPHPSSIFHYMTDHIDGNTLNNQRSNLRWVTISQNSMNRAKGMMNGKVCTSKFKGVSKYSRLNVWVAEITKDGKTKYLGKFINEVDAANAYNEAAKEIFGIHALINII
jgi:hypothetical protein